MEQRTERTTSTMSKKDLESLYKRIENTLKRASESPFEEERKTAMKLAQKMMMEYNISLDEIRRNTTSAEKREVIKEFVEIHEKNTKWWVRDLYWELAPHYRCKATENAKMHGKYGAMALHGLRDDVQICTEVCKFAKLSILYFAECYVNNMVNKLNNTPMKDREPIYQKWVKPSDFEGAKNDYIRGYLNGLVDALTKQEEEYKQVWGLVVLQPVELTEYLAKQKFGTAKTMSTKSELSTSGDYKHYSQGQKDGRKYVHKKAMIEE